MMLRALACLCLLCLGLSASAQTLPEAPAGSVADLADVLDATEEGRVARLLQGLRDETGVQMVVVTMADIGAHGGTGQRLEDYGRALFDAWGVGGAGRNDGILMLIVTDAREARIALGAGYDAVYDGRAARVLSTAVLPDLRAGRLAAGIEGGVVSARERLVAPFLAGTPVSVSDGFAEGGTGQFPWLPIGFAALVAGAIYAIWRRNRAKRTCPRCDEPTLNRVNEVIEPPGRFASGVGLSHLNCTSCGLVDRKSYAIRPKLTRGGREDPDDGPDRRVGNDKGSEPGGLGGGRSSGGGASGKW